MSETSDINSSSIQEVSELESNFAALHKFLTEKLSLILDRLDILDRKLDELCADEFNCEEEDLDESLEEYNPRNSRVSVRSAPRSVSSAHVPFATQLAALEATAGLSERLSMDDEKKAPEASNQVGQFRYR